VVADGAIRRRRVVGQNAGRSFASQHRTLKGWAPLCLADSCLGQRIWRWSCHFHFDWRIERVAMVFRRHLSGATHIGDALLFGVAESGLFVRVARSNKSLERTREG
jgi:hypothetical protein